MCKSIAQGGQRCAAHTRSAFSAATADVALGKEGAEGRFVQTAIAYASTREGQEVIGIHAQKAADRQDWETEAKLLNILARGAAMRSAATEVSNLLSAETPETEYDEDTLPTGPPVDDNLNRCVHCGETVEPGQNHNGFCSTHAELVLNHEEQLHAVDPNRECPLC